MLYAGRLIIDSGVKESTDRLFFSSVDMEAVVAPDPAAKSRHDFSLGRPERTLL